MAATFAFTIDGISRISGLQAGTLHITKTFGRRATLQCEVFSTDGSWHPTIDQEVVWSTDGTAKFGGYIREITYLGKKLRNNNSVFYAISCADYGSLLEDRLVTEEFPAGQTLKQWLTTLVTNWLSIKGISLDAAQTDGPTMSQPLQVERMRADVVLQQIMLRSEYVSRGISATKTLLLFASGSSSAPFNLTSTNRKALGDIQVSPLWNGQKYNRVIIKFGVAGVTEYFYQDSITVSGTPTSVTLNYTPVGWYPVSAGEAFGYGYLDSSVNGRGVVATDPSPYTQGYEFFPTTNTIQKFDGSAFANGEVLTIPYDFRYPIEVIEETSGASTDPIELLVIDESIRTNEEAELKAQRILAIVQTDTQRVHYYTAEDDLDVAQAQNINVAERFFNDDCIITDLRTSDTAANTGDATAVQFKLVHEVFATQGDQPKRTELDTVMQWSLLGSGSGAVPGTAPNSSGGNTVPPFDTYVLFNDNMQMGAAQGLRYISVASFSAPETRFVHPSAVSAYTRAQVTNTTGDFELEATGTLQLLAKQNIEIVADSDVTSTTGRIDVTATAGIDFIPGNVTSTANDFNGLTEIDGFAVNAIRVTSLPFTMDASMVDPSDLHTAFLVDTVSSGTFNLAGLSAVFTTRPSTAGARLVVIKKLQAGVLTLDGNGTDTINGSAVMSLAGGDATWLLAGPQATTNWQTVAGTGTGAGGSGGTLVAAGNDTEVQYNASGTLSAISTFTYDDAKKQLQLKQGGQTPLKIIDELATSVGGPIGFHMGADFYGEMLMGIDVVSDVATASQPNPGYFWHQGNPSGLRGIGAALVLSETVSAAVTFSVFRQFGITHDGKFTIEQTGGLGASATGCGVYVERNDSNSAAPAWLGLENRSAVPSYIWSDVSAMARIGLSAPTADNAVSVGSGYRVFAGHLVVKNADESVSASSVLQDDDELFWDVGTNEVWHFELVLFVTTGTSTTPDLKFNFSIPASATLSYAAQNLSDSATAINGTQFIYTSYRANQDGSAGILSTATISSTPVFISGVVRTAGTAGSVVFRWAQLTSNATNTVVKADSYIKATRVA